MTDVQSNGLRQGPRLIDTDVHPTLAEGIRSIYPYITREWRMQLEYREAFMPPASRLQHGRASAMRDEAVTPSGGYPGSDPAFMRTDYVDKWNVEYALLVAAQTSSVNAASFAAEAQVLARGYNDYFLDNWVDKDDRYRLAMVVAPQDPQAAAAEIRRVANPRRIAGVHLPRVNILAGNVYYHPIYEAAQDVGLPIIDHPNATTAQYQGVETWAGGVPSTHPEWVCGMVQMALSALTSLLFEGVFEKFPRLKWCFSEYGWAWLPGYMWRLDSYWKNHRMSVPWMRRRPSEYIRDHIRFTTQPLPEPPTPGEFRSVFDMCEGETLLMASTDYPHYDTDDPPVIARSFPAEARDKVMYQNAADFFGPELMPERQGLAVAAETSDTSAGRHAS